MIIMRGYSIFPRGSLNFSFRAFRKMVPDRCELEFLRELTNKVKRKRNSRKGHAG